MSATSGSWLRVSADRRRNGFTLVELLVVFALLALLAGVAPIAFERLRESADYRNTIRGMLSDMRQARQRAMAEGAEVRFRVDLSARTFAIDNRPAHSVPLPLQLRATVAGTELTADRSASIRFLPQGGATGGSIEVVRPSGAGVRLTVDWLSGSVVQMPLQK